MRTGPGALINAVKESLRLWGPKGIDFTELAADIAAEGASRARAWRPAPTPKRQGT